MRTIHVDQVCRAVEEMAIKTNIFLPDDVKETIMKARGAEDNPRAQGILKKIEENIRLSKEELIPLCQDTGLACIFIKVGQDVHFEGGDLYEAIHQGVRNGYKNGFLRKSVVEDPFRRTNTGDNTPANIHTDIVPGDKVTIILAPKGFGSENMSQIKMLPPSAGEEGAKDFIVNVVKEAGGNPCPPIIVGVGIGGTFDSAPSLSKQALLLPLDESNPDPFYRKMEEELLERINQLDVGPQGFGGKTTALAVKILSAPTHIAGLPVAVNINCHVGRHEKVVI